MIRKTIKVSDNNFRKFDDPLGNETPRKYIFYAKTCDVPEGIPMSTNPRDQKLNSTVANAITESLLSNDGQFHLKNRGIILSAKRVRYDNRLQEVTIDFEDESCHGNIDGGHTYKILLENKDKVLEQYVQFEVMTGVEAMIADLAEARNTSIAVDAKSMAELREKFDPIKEGLEGLPFFNRISFKQNQITKDTDTKKALKMIDARDIVSIICMFNIDKYNSAEHPTKAYSGKQAMLNEYLDDPEHYRKFVNVIPDLFDLYDAIETEFAVAYNENGRMYGRKSYSGYKEGSPVGKSKFCMSDIYYKFPMVFSIPFWQHSEFFSSMISPQASISGWTAKIPSLFGRSTKSDLQEVLWIWLALWATSLLFLEKTPAFGIMPTWYFRAWRELVWYELPCQTSC